MKRDEMVHKIAAIIDSCSGRSSVEMAHQILMIQEDSGMAPPSVSEDKAQALLSVYYSGGNFHQWDEDFEKDEKVMEALKRRAEAKERRDMRRNERRGLK